jgi:hypothetical protein
MRELKGKTVKVKFKCLPMTFSGETLKIEDTWANVYGKPWKQVYGNPAVLMYGMRVSMGGLPTDDNVYYGKDAGGLGHLIHESEIGDVVK